ncbi:hypothetical protein [Novosphingobium ginsenosidimutans]|uniref:Uncharacterized protein n=1 Tax=Novosphingobium ginsenosidimutans TaxID=1176536 RepID=A0A5B8S5I9_9SPHN|nr:hypothetical protein [Novosphingobium ginsenosidimutans]QEA16434.1 hypothetical protein FRF71_09995 [Novosphingobium ginsenosidimutans]
MAELHRDVVLKAIDTATSMAKWVLTSLLAISGAAAVAMWGLEISPAWKVGACAAFVTGIVLALLSAHLGAQSTPTQMVPLNQALGYWLSVKYDGIRDSNLEQSLAEDAEAERKKVRLPTICGWLSLVAFLVGCVVAAIGAVAD